MTDRQEIEFMSGGSRCRGYLYPAARNQTIVVMAHGFGGTQEGALAATARAFAEAGLPALSFDYRGFGISGGDERQVVDIKMQLEDLRSAIAFAKTFPRVQPEKVALWGSSLGGGHVIEVAAGDPTIGAVVAQMPFNGFPRKVEGRSRSATWRLLSVSVQDWWAGRRGRERTLMKAVGEPGEFAVIATKDAVKIVEQMDNVTWKNKVAPGALIDMALWYRPGRKAKQLRMPVLLSLAELDKEVPTALTRPIAMRAPRGELRCYPCSHFDFYKEPARSVVIADQISFLRTHLFGFN